jgi:hypothetical protein
VLTLATMSWILRTKRLADLGASLNVGRKGIVRGKTIKVVETGASLLRGTDRIFHYRVWHLRPSRGQGWCC